MNILRSSIIDLRNSFPDDDVFIKELNYLLENEGPMVCKLIFQILTSLEIPCDTAVEYWQKVLQHRKALSQLLVRNVDLMTAMSDFLRTNTNYLINSRFVNVSTFERILQEAMHDGLTGLFNRQYFEEAFKNQVSLAKRYDTDLSVLFIDVDNFKEINDAQGHIVGDGVLKKIGAIILNAKRESDIAARYGGEEFVLLMPHTESLKALILGNRIRQAVEQEEFSAPGQSFHLTISGGLSSYPQDTTDPKTLLQQADSATYLAKGAGKNNITLYRKEQRRYVRVKLTQPVLIKEMASIDSQIYKGTSKNICIGGILFKNDTPLPIGAHIQVSVHVNAEIPLLLIGTIVRIEAIDEKTYEIGMTISFKELEKIVQSEITQLLNWCDMRGDSKRSENPM